MDVTQLSVAQLGSLKKQLDDEVEHLVQSVGQLRTAQLRFRDCGQALDHGPLSSRRGAGGRSLVPLTMSLYVPGEIVGDGRVLVDIGTGFLVEKVGLWPGNRDETAKKPQPIEDAKNFYSRKTTELGQNLKDIEAMAQGKSNNLRMVEEGERSRKEIILRRKHDTMSN